MESKHITNLQVGDLLKRKDTNELVYLNQIINPDKQDTQKNYVFDGFAVFEKVIKKFFASDNTGIFIYNKKEKI